MYVQVHLKFNLLTFGVFKISSIKLSHVIEISAGVLIIYNVTNVNFSRTYYIGNQIYVLNINIVLQRITKLFCKLN